jgi:hypothetical protein
MKPKLLSMILFTLLLNVSASFQTYAQQAEKSKEKECPKECPLNSCAFNFTPISFWGLADAPAKITLISVSCGIDGVMPTGIDLRNLSGKTITAVKFQWYLYRDDSSEKIKIRTQGETPLIDVGECQPEKECVVNNPVVCCQEVYKALLEDGSFEGKFWIEHSVSELSYEDGSKWKRK